MQKQSINAYNNIISVILKEQTKNRTVIIDLENKQFLANTNLAIELVDTLLENKIPENISLISRTNSISKSFSSAILESEKIDIDISCYSLCNFKIKEKMLIVLARMGVTVNNVSEKLLNSVCKLLDLELFPIEILKISKENSRLLITVGQINIVLTLKDLKLVPCKK